MSSPGIKREDYAFTVEVQGEKWHVYYFVKDGKRGTMAFTPRDGKFTIGLFCAGNLTEAQAKAKLEEAHQSESN
jgi:hypothetical protein